MRVITPKIAPTSAAAVPETRTIANEPARLWEHTQLRMSAIIAHPHVAAPYLWAVTRLCLGWVFLWPFLDKTFGLGHETTTAHAWIHGGSPSFGFLSGAIGPFAGFYQSIAGNGLVNWLFMLGLLGVAVALLAGIGMRIAAGAGAVMLLLMWSASLPPADDIFMDNHIVYALVLVGLVLVGAGNTFGFGRWWSQTSLVQRFPWLT